MDEEIEKPFPIELIVILVIIALANDVAEIFFDLLDFTGVGIAGEAIMEPADLILDVFFSGIFIWKMGFGGTPTIIQYVDDLLELVLVPGRTISIGAGIWVANHPGSTVALIASNAADLAGGNVAGTIGKAGGAAKTVEKEAASAGGKTLQGGAQEAGKAAADEGGGSASAPRSSGGENAGGPESDVFKNPYANPVGTAGEEVFNPSEDRIQEAGGIGTKKAPQEDDRPQDGIHLVKRQPPTPPAEDESENVQEEGFPNAA